MKSKISSLKRLIKAGKPLGRQIKKKKDTYKLQITEIKKRTSLPNQQIFSYLKITTEGKYKA